MVVEELPSPFLGLEPGYAATVPGDAVAFLDDPRCIAVREPALTHVSVDLIVVDDADADDGKFAGLVVGAKRAPVCSLKFSASTDTAVRRPDPRPEDELFPAA